MQLFDSASSPTSTAPLRGSGLVDGVMPAIIRTVAVQDPTSRQTEPRVDAVRARSDRARRLRPITGSDGAPSRSAASRRARSSSNRDAAAALGAPRGDTHRRAGRRPHLAAARGRRRRRYRGAGTAKAAMLVPLAARATRARRCGQGRGDPRLQPRRRDHGVAHTDAVVGATRARRSTALGLETQPVKRDGLKAADNAGAAFMLDVHARSAASRSRPASC